jgi:hypothetical protein
MKRALKWFFIWLIGGTLNLILLVGGSALAFALFGGVAAVIGLGVAWVLGLDAYAVAGRAGMLFGGIGCVVNFVWGGVQTFDNMCEKFAKARMKEALAEEGFE